MLPHLPNEVVLWVGVVFYFRVVSSYLRERKRIAGQEQQEKRRWSSSGRQE